MKKQGFHYTREFDKAYEYQGKDLGSFCGAAETAFKIWAPFAESVQLCLYGDGGSSMKLTVEDSLRDADRVLDMESAPRGIWTLTVPENLDGWYYDFLVGTDGEMVRTADPYARACCCNGQRSMVVDLTRTNPAGFDEDHAPEKPVENIIYELHIKDFSYDRDSRIPEEYRGKYKAFSAEPAKGDYPVCVEYLKQLGITHVHLLPCFDFGWLDEEIGRAHV